MDIRDFVFCAKHNMLDVRHYMLGGFAAIAMTVGFVSNSSLQAKPVPEEILAQRKMNAAPKVAALPSQLISNHNSTQAALPEYDVKDMMKRIGLARENKELKKVASLQIQDGERYSSKKISSCSVEAIQAAANGDSRLISPCIEVLLSGDENAIYDLPNKMKSFIIETANDPEKRKNMPQIFMNSMMAMMEGMSKASDKE